MKFDIHNRVTGAVQFTADIDCDDDTLYPLKIGLAVKWAIGNKVNLAGANLAGAYLAGAKNAALAAALVSILPEGDLIGWKKCKNGVLVKLRIPADAKRSNATGRKCRAEYVDVLEVIGTEVGITDEYGPRTEYRTGERVTCHEWDAYRWRECSGGIHFFITREEAEAW